MSRDNGIQNQNPSKTVFRLHHYRKEERLLNAKPVCEFKLTGHSPLTFPIKLLPFAELPLTGCLLGYFSHHSVQTLNGDPRRSVSKIFKPAHLSPTTMLLSKSLKSHFPSFWCWMSTLTEAVGVHLLALCIVLLTQDQIIAWMSGCLRVPNNVASEYIYNFVHNKIVPMSVCVCKREGPV